MILILEVISAQRAKLGGASRQTFDHDGGSIGRENDNDWVLPHAKVSGHHAVISSRDDVYYIEDKSRNGICLNSTRNRLDRGRPHPLTSGDRILIDPYEIQVTIGRDEYEPAGRGAVAGPEVRPLDRPLIANPFGESDDPFAPRSFPSSGLDAPEEAIAGQEVDPLALLNLAPPERPPVRNPHRAKDLDLGSLLDDHFQPPDVFRDPEYVSPENPGAIPEDYDPLSPIPHDYDPLAPESRHDRPLAGESRHDNPPAADPPGYEPFAPQPLPPPPVPVVAGTGSSGAAARPAWRSGRSSTAGRHRARADAAATPGIRSRLTLPLLSTAAAARSSSADFAALLAGAGLDPADVTPELARTFGQILRVVVSGVMDVMRSRQQIKDEFRMRMTRVQAGGEQPAQVFRERRRRAPQPAGEAQSRLSRARSKRSKTPSPTCGIIRSRCWPACGWRSNRCSPSSIRTVCSRSSIVSSAKVWCRRSFAIGISFGTSVSEIVKDPEASFRRLFGEEFARAYEEQLKQLKAQDGSAGRASARTPRPPTRDSLGPDPATLR